MPTHQDQTHLWLPPFELVPGDIDLRPEQLATRVVAQQLEPLIRRLEQRRSFDFEMREQLRTIVQTGRVWVFEGEGRGHRSGVAAAHHLLEQAGAQELEAATHAAAFIDFNDAARAAEFVEAADLVHKRFLQGRTAVQQVNLHDRPADRSWLTVLLGGGER